MNCFQLYFQPVYIYIKKAFNLAFEDNYSAVILSSSLAATMQVLQDIFAVEFFGIPNILLFLVVITVLLDAYYGVKKSVKKSKEALIESKQYKEGSLEFKKFVKIYELKKFKPIKLQFTFFKVFTLLGYLFFAKTLLQADIDSVLGEIIGFTSALILKIPITIFWYYDFKSIGENTEYIYGKKAPIFSIVESIFGLKLAKYLKNGRQTNVRED